MKQVLISTKSFVLSSRRHHLDPQRTVFSKYLCVLLLAGFALFISSCQKDELQGSLQKQELQATSQKQDLLNSSQKQDDENKCVPFKGKFTISFTETGVDGTGTASHIGRFTFVANNQLGTIIITAANGDQIFTTFTITVHEPQADNMVMLHLDNTITGGTGRFAGATGSFGMDVLVNENLGTGAGTLDGTICY